MSTPASTRSRPARSRPGQERTAPGARRPRLPRLTSGPRPLLLVFGLVVVLLAAMALTPVQRYLASAQRVSALESTRDQLRAEVDALEERRARLHDPEELELRAREQLGMVKPGELPYVVVPPEDGPERVEEAAPPVAPPPPEPWWQRILARLPWN